MRFPEGPRAGRIDPILVFLLAVAAGVVNWWFLRESAFLARPIIDAAEYVADARAIVAGIPYWERQPIHGPLYPLFLAPFVALLETPLPAIYFSQILLLAVSALLVRRAGVVLGGRLVGNAAGVLVALAPPMLYFEVQALPVVLQVFLHSLLLSVLAGGSRSARALAAAGLAGGLSVLAHPGAAYFLLPLALFLFLREGMRVRALSFAGGAFLPLLLVSIASAAAGGSAFPLSRNAGLNFYVGNGPASDGTAHVRPGYEWERLTALPLLDGASGPAEENRFFFRKTLEGWKAEPLAAVRRIAAKALLFAAASPIDASQDFILFRDRSPLLRASFLDAGVLVPLAFGILAAGRLGGGWAPAAIGIAGTWIGVALTVFAVRYRAPVWPFLALAASAFAANGARYPKATVVRGAFAAIALLLVASSDPFGYRGKNPVRSDYNLARLEYERGNTREAAALFEAMWEETGDADAANGLGGVRMAEADGAEAAAGRFREALGAKPDYADARFNLALALLRLGREGEGEEEVRRAIALAPGHAPALYLRGIIEERKGLAGEAELSYRESLRRDPTRADAWNALGVLLARRGDSREAETCFERALRLEPRSASARENLARLRAGSGRGPAESRGR